MTTQDSNRMTPEQAIEEQRSEYAKESPRARRYAICTKGIDMTCLSIELERLERVGVRKSLTDRWHAQAMELLDEILSVSDVMGVEK